MNKESNGLSHPQLNKWTHCPRYLSPVGLTFAWRTLFFIPRRTKHSRDYSEKTSVTATCNCVVQIRCKFLTKRQLRRPKRAKFWLLFFYQINTTARIPSALPSAVILNIDWQTSLSASKSFFTRWENLAATACPFRLMPTPKGLKIWEINIQFWWQQRLLFPPSVSKRNYLIYRLLTINKRGLGQT